MGLPISTLDLGAGRLVSVPRGTLDLGAGRSVRAPRDKSYERILTGDKWSGSVLLKSEGRILVGLF